MTLPRPLTPLERALLRAVVELGDKAATCALAFRAGREIGTALTISEACTVMERLEGDGFVAWTEEGYGWVRYYWRPARDLTAVLGGGEGKGEDVKA